MGIYGEDRLRTLRKPNEGISMLALDGKLRGQLGMQTNGGVWHRLDLYDTKRRRGPSKPRRKSTAKASPVAAKPATLVDWHAVCETATRGFDRAFTAKAASKTEFDRMAKHHCEKSGWKFLWSKKAALMGK